MPILYADPAQFDPGFLSALLPKLPPEKQQALQKINHARARRESILGWALLVFVWKTLRPKEALPALSFAAHGKPAFQNGGLHFNISHTDALVCLAVSEDCEIGVDAQTCIAPCDALARRVLTEAEQAALAAAKDRNNCFTRFWTQKEALVKQTGEGLSRDLKTLDFSAFAEQDAFFALGLSFQTLTLEGAIVTQCAQRLKEDEPRRVTRQDLENALF